MNPQSLTPAQLERAATAACHNLDLNPAEMVPNINDGAGPFYRRSETAHHIRRQVLMKGEIMRAYAISAAIMEVLNEP